jgi:16S rRNA (uracil1498-N3)-methyltransferase
LAERRRFVIEPADCEDVILLEPGEAVHLIRVLRLGTGDLVEAADGRGWLYTLELQPLDKGEAYGKVLDKRRAVEESRPKIIVAAGLIKGPRMDWAVEKAAEMGARAFVPFISERTVALGGSEGRKVHRWRRLARAALKQSLGAFEMRVSSPRSFERVVELARRVGVALVGDEGAPRMDLSASDRAAKRSVLLVVGPEGSLSPKELKALGGAGATRFSIGGLRLRSETAVVVGMAAILQELA